MSWIIRSRTTSTSVPRSGNGPIRWISPKRGRSICSRTTRIAALNHS